MLKLKELRIAKGISQTKIADLLGTSKQAISMYENGQREPNIEYLIKLAVILDTTVDELINFRNIYDQVHEELYSKVNEVTKEIK